MAVLLTFVKFVTVIGNRSKSFNATTATQVSELFGKYPSPSQTFIIDRA